MAKPAHDRVTFEGVIGTVAAPLEHWSFNVNFPPEPDPVNTSQVVDDLVAADLHSAWVDNLAGNMPSDCRLTRVKVAHVAGTGLVVRRADGSYSQGEWTGDVAGGQPVQQMPLQTALCVSLTTERAGATGKGRFFLPWPATLVEAADKRIAVSVASTMATNSVAFLNDLATVMTNAPVVASSKGYLSEVTGVKVGRVPDTLRSRRTDLPEGWIALPL